ncbi:hypothetical protein [Phocoenobacter uteri]|nr:hypothetical protein [Phocoenobacter uteri]
MKQYGQKDLFIGSHSRGTMTVGNALRELNTEENREKALLSKTDIKMVGPAENVSQVDKILNQLQGLGDERTNKEHSIRIESHEGDMVGGFPIGNNPSTTNTNTHKKGNISMILDIFGDKSSSHNCYGLGQTQCIKDGYRKDKKDLYMHPENTIFELNNSNQLKKE